MLGWFWIIPFLPFAGALINGLAGRRLPRAVVAGVACGAVLLAFLVSAGAFLELRGDLPDPAAAGMRVDAERRQVQVRLWEWIPGGPDGAFAVDWGFLLDPLSAVMILVVTGVGFLIHVYSVGYMHGDPGFARYFTYLNLFTGMMLTLVLGSSFPVLFVGWEGVGLCSYLLIGFWYEDIAKAKAGMKAFVVNRIGDFGFMIGMLLLFVAFGTLDIQEVMRHAGGGTAALTAVALLLFVGATGKSAQLPLHVWLPDAMAGPTPVSALIHAATMVTAGVYMVARSSAIFVNAPHAMATVMIVGAVTAMFAATIATAQTDIKKVLAYSTVSQLGYMFLACGVGAFTAGIFHLTMHAFFKALLFLGAGSVIHAMSGEQDLFKMGGLRKKLPATYVTMLVGTLAIAGIPPLAGFFSKDEILAKAWEGGHVLIWLMGSVTALMTSFYVFRLIFLAFHGEGRMDEKTAAHVHESPAVMTAPLWVLAGLAAVGGLIGVPAAQSGSEASNRFEHWLEPVFARSTELTAGPSTPLGAGHSMELTASRPTVLAAGPSTDLAAGASTAIAASAATMHATGATALPSPAHGGATAYLLMGLAVALAAGGWVIAGFLYRRGGAGACRLAGKVAPLHRLLVARYYVDELYDRIAVMPFMRACWTLDVFDRGVIDGTVNGSGAAAEVSGQVVKLFHTGYVRNYALSFLLGVVFVLWYLLVR